LIFGAKATYKTDSTVPATPVPSLAQTLKDLNVAPRL
jgi:hypothetical protein